MKSGILVTKRQVCATLLVFVIGLISVGLLVGLTKHHHLPCNDKPSSVLYSNGYNNSYNKPKQTASDGDVDSSTTSTLTLSQSQESSTLLTTALSMQTEKDNATTSTTLYMQTEKDNTTTSTTLSMQTEKDTDVNVTEIKIPKEKLKKTNQDDDELPWHKPFLPDHLYPLHYALYMNPDFYNKGGTFQGFVNITVNITQDTQYLVVHSKGISITATKLQDSTQQTINITRAFDYVRNQYFVVQTESVLTAGSVVFCMFEFSGSLLGGYRGFFKSVYTNTQTGGLR